MNKSRAYVFLSCYLFVCAASAKPFKVCHVSSAVSSLLPRANDKNILFGGFETAIDEFITKNKLSPKDVEFVAYQNPTESLAVLDGLAKAKSDGCDLIVGLITSKDALIAGPFLMENNLLGISSTATNDGISKYRSNLLSFSTSASSYVKSFVDWTSSNSVKANEIAVVFKPTEVYSLFFKDEIKKLLPSAVIINFDDLQQNDDLRAKLKSLKAIFVSTYPLESIVILKELKSLLQSKSKKIDIFGTQSWTEVQAFSTNPDLLDNFKNIYMFSPWDFYRETVEMKQFKNKYKGKFKILPDHDSVYDFDTLSFALMCAYDLKAKILSAKNLKSCFDGNRRFSGVTGTYEFRTDLSHPVRKDFLFEYRKYLEMRRHR